MVNNIEERAEKVEFGPFKSRLYSFFASRSREHKVVYEKIVSDMKTLNPRKVLDIGCGPGIVSAMIAETLPEAQIFCIDPSRSMVDIANRRFKKLKLEDRVYAKIGSSENINLDGNFDVIFTSLSFHHWKNGVEDLTKLVKKLLPRGIFIIYEHLMKGSGKGQTAIRYGISKEFVESIVLTDFTKSYEIVGKLVILKFSKLE